MLNTAAFKTKTSIVLFVTFILLSYPIPWTHWALTRHLKTREETYHMKVSVSERWPSPIRWYAEIFDELQFWLIDRWVCVRHQEHKIFHLWYSTLFPSRTEGMLLPSDHYPVLVIASVGMPSWSLPKINIIDYWGLNDYVIARNPSKPVGIRLMGHERKPPKGYVECFKPNAKLYSGQRRIVIFERNKKLTADDIIECEREWGQRVE